MIDKFNKLKTGGIDVPTEIESIINKPDCKNNFV